MALTTKIWCERSRCLIEVPVVWNGEQRYLTTPLPAPPPRVERRHAPRPQSRVTEAWLQSEHGRAHDVARVRMFAAARCASAPFTVEELATAARVSKTLVRRFLRRARRRGECRLVGRRPTARTFADLFAFEAAPVIDVLVARVACGDDAQGAE
jgi:hypothetical protein